MAKFKVDVPVILPTTSRSALSKNCSSPQSFSRERDAESVRHNDYYSSLARSLNEDSDESLLHLIQQCPIPLSKQEVLFQNHGPSLDAFERIILRSRRSTIWPRLLGVGVSPVALIPPRKLRLYPSYHSWEAMSPTSSTATTSSDCGVPGRKQEHLVTRWTVLSSTYQQLVQAGCRTVLALASKLSRLNIFFILLRAIPKSERSLEVQADLDSTLRYTCEIGTDDVVLKLLHEGADPNSIKPGTCSALHHAVKTCYGKLAKVRCLLNFHADPNLLCPADGKSALMEAVTQRDETLVRLLLQHGADCNTALPNYGLPTPLFYAVYWGLWNIVQVMCSEGHLDMKYKTTSGETVLDIARNSLDFAKAPKPRHILRLPLPKTNVRTCERLVALLESEAKRQAEHDSLELTAEWKSLVGLESALDYPELIETFPIARIQSPFDDNDPALLPLEFVSYYVCCDSPT